MLPVTQCYTSLPPLPNVASRRPLNSDGASPAELKLRSWAPWEVAPTPLTDISPTRAQWSKLTPTGYNRFLEAKYLFTNFLWVLLNPKMIHHSIPTQQSIVAEVSSPNSQSRFVNWQRMTKCYFTWSTACKVTATQHTARSEQILQSKCGF